MHRCPSCRKTIPDHQAFHFASGKHSTCHVWDLNRQYYAGIGSRTTPEDIIELMQHYAQRLSDKNYILRSGGAVGADKAFETGAFNKIIYKPVDATEKSINLASTIHPAWHRCSFSARKLLGRNCMIILGGDLAVPVNFVLCWTTNEDRGGTSLGIKLAKKNQIPVYNLYWESHRKGFEEWLMQI